MSSELFSLSGMSSPVDIVDQVIRQGIKMNASDILFEPAETETIVRFRIDGILQGFGTMPRGSYDQVLARFKVLAGMDVAESRKPQESKVKLNLDGRPYVLRLAIISTNYGQMIAARILDMPQYVEYEQLGMSSAMAAKIKENISGRYGLFLVCGPTGSGKTTTVHASLKHLNTGGVNIMTIEDPIEYIVSGINQIQVGEDVGLDFVSALRMILRLNPDIVFVGEIRDAETARIAIQASLTGHLVISTIHSRNSIGALYRLKDLGVETYMINYALRAIVAQRLLRRVCDQCKETYVPTSEETAFYIKEKGQAPSNLMHGRGCENCHTTRYKGRAGIFELLEMDDNVRSLIAQGVNESTFRENMKSKGFLDMSHEGLALVDSGVTSLREYIRTINDAK